MNALLVIRNSHVGLRHLNGTTTRVLSSCGNKPVVHTRDREPVAHMVKRWLDSREVLDSNPTDFFN